MTRSRRGLLVALGSAGLATLGGCSTGEWVGSGDNRDGNPSTGRETATTTPTDTLTPTPETVESALPAQRPTEVVASDGDAGDNFGAAAVISADGSTAVVGAFADEDPNGKNAGSAYVFERPDGTWSQQAKLVAADGDAGDSFGGSVAVSDDGRTALVGASDDEDPNGDRSGSAYVFGRAGGSWSQQAKLAAGDGDPGDSFGCSVALSADGSTAVVGGFADEDPNGTGGGSVVVFERSGDEWNQRSRFADETGDPGDWFGWAVEVSADGTTVVVGAPSDEDPSGRYGGSASVYDGSGGSWTRQAKLAAGDAGDAFGWTVDLSDDGTTALVGAPYDEGRGQKRSGSAYLFDRGGGTWTQRSRLVADDGDAKDALGRSVGLSGDGSLALVGAPSDENPDGPRGGAAYVFAADAGWQQHVKIAGKDDSGGDHFGSSVGVAGQGATAVVGAPGDGDPNGTSSGSAHVFE